MHPVLFEIETLHLRIHVYGLLYALGFLVGLLWIRYESKRVGLNVEAMSDLFFYILIAGTLTSRLFYVVFEAPELLSKPLEIFKIWKGGLVYYGGVIGAVVAGIVICRKKRLPAWKVFDVYAPGLALGHVLGRLGCFFAGCCYGRQCDPHAWYAVVFPDTEHGIAPPGIALYPSQVMESIGDLLIFAVLVVFRRHKTFDGQVFMLYVISYGVLRSTIELFRNDESRNFVIPGLFSSAQGISLLAIVGVISVWMWRKKHIR